MPVIKVNLDDLRILLGVAITREDILEKVPMLGCDVSALDGGELAIEFFPNRPDLYSTEGVARALRAFLGMTPGLRKYKPVRSGIAIDVDPSVEGVRRYIAACAVTGVRLTERILQGLIEVQEDLHWALGRGRRKVAIGVHDPAAVKLPYRYTTSLPKDTRFVPLGMAEELTLGEVLQKHPKGVEYGSTLAGMERYPVILDADGRVLSMPPVINGELTKVTPAAEELFIEVTGTDEASVNRAMNILATACAERGWEIGTVEVRYPGRRVETPDLGPAKMKLRLAYLQKTLGAAIGPEEASRALERMGFGCRAKGGSLEVLVPCYRTDILHEIDLVEDAAIGYGYGRLAEVLPPIPAVGGEEPVEHLCEDLRGLMLGYGFTEVMTLLLTNPEDNSRRLGLDETSIEVRNPISEEHTILRTNLLQGLLGVLRLNKHRELPLRVFEVGDVVLPVDGVETGAMGVRRLGACAMHPRANFTEAKSFAQGLLRDLGLEYGLKRYDYPPFIPGRCASVLAGGKVLGYFGELHPRVLTAFGLEYPVVALELDLGIALRNKSG